MRGTIAAIRGATQVAADEPELIIRATEELITAVVAANDLVAGNLISLFFTATPDLRSAFPAEAARRLCLTDTPLMCACEIDVPGALPRVVRLMAQVDFGAVPPEKVHHVYLHGAETLRLDLTPEGARSYTDVASVKAELIKAELIEAARLGGSHDTSAALTSHLPHLISSAMAAALVEADPAALLLADSDLRDMTRLAVGDPTLWTKILGWNAMRVARLLSNIVADLSEVCAALELAAMGETSFMREVTALLIRGQAGQRLLTLEPTRPLSAPRPDHKPLPSAPRSRTTEVQHGNHHGQ